MNRIKALSKVNPSELTSKWEVYKCPHCRNGLIYPYSYLEDFSFSEQCEECKGSGKLAILKNTR